MKLQEQEKKQEPLSDREEAMMRELKRRQDCVSEIERRKQVAVSGSETDASKLQNRKPLDMDVVSQQLVANHDYTFAVINKAHRSLNPKSTRPAFRILGLFRSLKGDFADWMDEMRDCNQIYKDESDGQGQIQTGRSAQIASLEIHSDSEDTVS